MVFLKGKGIRQGASIGDADNSSVTPTVLHLLGLPVGEDMTGKVLSEALEPEYSTIRRIPTWETERNQLEDVVLGAETDEEILERLRSLGYVD